MRFLSLLKKAAIENFRDWKMLSLTLTFAPVFVVLMHAYFHEGQDPFRLVVLNEDEGVPVPGTGTLSAGDLLIGQMRSAEGTDGRPVFQVEVGRDLARAQRRLDRGAIDLIVVLPENLSAVLLAYQGGGRPPPAEVKTYGDPSNASYLMAAVWSDVLTYEYAASLSGQSGPVVLQSVTSGKAASLTEYEAYVPGLLALAVMMLMFTAAATLIREKDQGTLVRLRMSRMTTLEWLGSVSVVQVVLGVVAVALALLTAAALGYRTSGDLLALFAVTALSALAIMAFSVIVAALLRTNFDLVTIGCFPFFLLMFFSGGMFPLPNVRLFEWGGRALNLNDLLPTTHTIRAYDRILNRDAGLTGLGFELAAIAVLALVFFALGTWLFARRHMRAA